MSSSDFNSTLFPDPGRHDPLAALGSGVFATVLESLSSGVYLVDRERRILFWNNGAETITGYLRHEVLGRACANELLMHCDSQHNLLCGIACPLSATMHDGHPRDANVFLLHKNGWRVPVRVRAVPIRDDAGQIIGAAETFDEFSHLMHATPRIHGVLAPGRTDPMSGNANRNTVRAGLQARLAECDETGIPLAVIGLAVERLEAIRHAYGRKCVEAIMEAVEATLNKNVPEGDIVGRWSEDTFMVIARHCPSVLLARFTGALKRIVGMIAIPWWGDRLHVSVALGATSSCQGDTLDVLLTRTEQALQSCIARGGNETEIV